MKIPKVRKTWKINPKTKIQKNKKKNNVYNRFLEEYYQENW